MRAGRRARGASGRGGRQVYAEGGVEASAEGGGRPLYENFCSTYRGAMLENGNTPRLFLA